MSLAPAAEAGPATDGRNRVTGRITEAGFTGVSTQYVVESPAGKALQVYEQNTGERRGFAPGSEVVLHWDPAHTFALDAALDMEAGVQSVQDTP